MLSYRKPKAPMDPDRKPKSPMDPNRNWVSCRALLSTLLLSSLLSRASAAPISLAAARKQYCTDNQYFWYPDGTTKEGGADWSSANRHAAFAPGPCLAVSGIGVTVTHTKTLIIIDRSAASNGYMHLDGRPKDLAYAQEVNLVSRKQRPLDIITNTFCSSGQHTAGGTFLSIGGDWSPDYAGPGEFSIRTFDPCTDGTCTFNVTAQLARSRWYPTTALLGDGRTIIVGGSSKGVGLNDLKANVPYIEYYPRADGTDGILVEFLNDALPYNLFPYVHVLPSGRVFVFASHKWILWDAIKNAVVPGAYPEIDAKDGAGNPLRFSYPTAGTSAMFPLTSANQYSAEIMICGGSATGAMYWKVPPTATKDGKGVDDKEYPATNKCFRIVPEAAAPTWTEETMATPRVMPVSVLLPDGFLLIINGMQTGHSGLGLVARRPALVPEMFHTRKHIWFKKPLPASKIPRSYHSSAVLVHNGAVMVTGSNPNDNIVSGNVEFPTEFRSEFFLPPYIKRFFRPKLMDAPANLAYGGSFNVTFKTYFKPKALRIVLAQPGFSTHGSNHGMRNVEINIIALSNDGAVNGTVSEATVAVPANRNLIPPTWYYLFVVADGTPNREGHHCFVDGV